MPDNYDPMPALERLRDALAAESSKLGLEMFQFEVTLAKQGNFIQVIYAIDSDKIGQDAEQASYDAEFEKLAQGLQADKDQDKHAAALDNLERMRKSLEEGGGGLFGEPE